MANCNRRDAVTLATPVGSSAAGPKPGRASFTPKLAGRSVERVGVCIGKMKIRVEWRQTAMANSWLCPYCNHYATITEKDKHGSLTSIASNSKYGALAFSFGAIVCPNPQCREITLTTTLSAFKSREGEDAEASFPARRWNLLPAANVKVFPEYVPAQILADYREACLIKDLSAKASATLARRCLQGIIRDFWNVKPGRLVDEIEAIRERVDPTTWEAIDAIRKIGNIGAHMEKDINVIIDVDPDEAGLLIGLIETLIMDWYIARHERAERVAKVVAAAQSKKV